MTNHLLRAAILFASLPYLALAHELPQVRFDRITTENILRIKGLSQNSVSCILQDTEGYMWFGTWDGLNKYDGYEFTVYNLEDGLSNTTVRSILQDKDGFIWIGTDYGLNRLDPETNRITVFLHDPVNPNSLCDNMVNCLMLDKDGFLWAGTSKGLSKYDPQRNVFNTIQFISRYDQDGLANLVSKVIQDSHGRIWIATHNGIYCFDEDRDHYRPYHFTDPGKSSRTERLANIVLDFIEDDNGKIWAGTRNGIFILDPETDSLRHIIPGPEEGMLSSSNVNAIFQDHTGSIWIGTDNFLNYYHPETGKFSTLRSSSVTTSLSNNDIRSIYQDPGGTLWIGTYKGVNKVDESPSRFDHYHHEPDDPASLSDNIVYSFDMDGKGRMIIATYGGVNFFDRQSGNFSSLQHDVADPNSLVSNKVRTVLCDSRGYYWFGTESQGLNRYDESSGRFELFQFDPEDTSSVSDNFIYHLMEDSKGRIWVSTGRGISIHVRGREGFQHIIHRPGDPQSLLSHLVYSCYEDSRGYFWVCTNKGLNRISPDLVNFEAFTSDPDDPETLKTNRIFFIMEDSDGIFWIGTMGGGLNRFDPSVGKFKSYTEQQGLPNNVAYAAIEDRQGYLWVPTNWGLSRFDKKMETFINYDIKDGLQGNEFNAGAYYKNDEGELFFGGMNGFNMFNPAYIRRNNIPPRIVITEFRIFNEPVNRHFEDGDTIFLKHSDNFFSFEFSALDYTNPSKNHFRYKLEDYDRDWINRDASQRNADYKRVSPGTYHFVLTGSNNDGVWNLDGIRLTVIITPPWWDTWIFRLAFMLSLVAVIWWFIYLRIRMIRKQHEVDKKMLNIEKQVFELEQKALRLQMNPHFIFNSLNAIQNFVLSSETDKAVNYLAKFSHLMRMILANSTEPYIPLKDELKALVHYMDLEKLRFDNKFDYKIVLEEGFDEGFIEIPPMLLQPYVENAIIHGIMHSKKPGIIDISFRLQNELLFCIIRDNGIGRDEAARIREQSGIRRQPRGMMITRERMEILRKQARKNFSVRVIDLKDADGRPEGTQVEITIQYNEISA